LNKINWIINKNEFWQLIGPNGYGKTIILSVIYGNIVKAYEQKVYLFVRKKGSGEGVWEMKEKIGYFSPAML
jgi:molybdate transport system ATP-binding protein